MTPEWIRRGQGQRPTTGSSARTDDSLISTIAMSSRAWVGRAARRQSYVCASARRPGSDAAQPSASPAPSTPIPNPIRARLSRQDDNTTLSRTAAGYRRRNFSREGGKGLEEFLRKEP